MKFISLFLSFILLFSGCASSKTAKKTPVTPDPYSEEAVIGMRIHDQIMSSFYPYTQPETVQYINEVGAELAEHAERKDLQYRFTILYSDKIYAASAPGGYVYLTTAMLFFLKSEAQLAAVMAHEIGELQYRDPKIHQASAMLDTLTKAGAMAVSSLGPIGILGALGLMVIYDKKNPEAEPQLPEERVFEADRKAMDYMVKAGYDPQGMIDLFYIFSNAGEAVVPYFHEYYQARPISPARYENVETLFKKLSLDGKKLTTNPERYQEMTKGIREIYAAGGT